MRRWQDGCGGSGRGPWLTGWGQGFQGKVICFFYIFTVTLNLLADTLRPVPLPQLLNYWCTALSGHPLPNMAMPVSHTVVNCSAVLPGLLDAEVKGT